MGARREYQTLSPEGQREFDRWLKANAILGALFGIGMLTMALAGIHSVGPDAQIAAVVQPHGQR
jgi:hypothetical protein